MKSAQKILKQFRRSPREFMEIYGANVAGFLWGSGTALQFAFGLIAWSPLQVTSSIFNAASPGSYLVLGHRNLGIVMGGLFGTIGTFLAVYPGIANGENELDFRVFILPAFRHDLHFQPSAYQTFCAP